MFEIKGKYTSAKVMIDDVEESCVSQIFSFVNHIAFTKPVAIMSDCHAGKGAVIGFTMPMTDKVVPNVIGVDISCGVRSVNIGPTISLGFDQLDHKIRQRVPFGKNVHDKPVLNMKTDFPWRRVNVLAQKFALAYGSKFGVSLQLPTFDMDWFLDKVRAIGGDVGRVINSLGTLGGGNHFVEVGISTKGDYWVTIHTGSRNFGKRICEYWQDRASKKAKRLGKEEHKALLADLKAKYKGEELYRRVKALKEVPETPEAPTEVFSCPDDQRWLEGADAQGYLMDMLFAQIYAEVNRDLIMDSILDILKIGDPIDTIETIHNFVDFQDFIVRKGAIRSYIGERMVIPFNMRDGILICEGKSNPEWNFSAPHGAGRVLSRSQAKKHIDLEEFREQMAGIYSTSVGTGTLDEAPDAYKDARVIEEAIEPTAVILDRIKPLHNMKDSLGTDD